MLSHPSVSSIPSMVSTELRNLGVGVSAGLFVLPTVLECPVCQTSNVHSESAEGELCRHCRCDLGVLWEIQGAAADHLVQAGDAMALEDAKGTFSHALRSWEMVHSIQSAAVAALASAMLGETATVHVWIQEMRKLRSGGNSRLDSHRR